jgi:DNA processing protein
MNSHNTADFDLEPIYLYILSLLPVRRLEIFQKWRQAAGSFEAIYLADEAQLASFGLGLELIIKLREIKKENSVEKISEDLERTSVYTLPYFDPRYPKLLKEIYDAPPVLFYRGRLGKPEEPCVAIVGSRKMSSYGSAVMSRITTPLIDAGLTIVSGLALGIDGAAHAESIKRDARTIAVLGCGVDEATVYPRTHFRLAEQILDNDGLIVSEQPPFMPALKHHLIARNRIIAGLSLGVTILECKIKSGALITADYAADFNRSLYAVPGPAYSILSEGPHHLIRNGATLVSRGEEILEDLAIALPQLQIKEPGQFTEREQRVLKCLQSSPATIDVIVKETNINTMEILQTLTTLELRGTIKNLGAEGFLKTK